METFSYLVMAGTQNHPTTQKRRSATIGYFNGPLEPGVSYSIFQRIIINDEVGIGDYKHDWKFDRNVATTGGHAKSCA